MVIEHLTDQGVMDPALLYEPPFTDVAPTGPEACLTKRASRDSSDHRDDQRQRGRLRQA